MDVVERNRRSWAEKVRQGNPWTIPVDSAAIEKARKGDWNIMITATRPVPSDWFPPLAGKKVLCLASGGGQQGPILAAAGADVTVLDICEEQLERDRLLAAEEGLALSTVCAGMADLSMFGAQIFDLVIHPVSNLYVPCIQPVWDEAFRVLRRGGILISGFMNPVFYLFDWELEAKGILQVRHALPYSDLDYPEEYEVTENSAVEFGHTLEAQIQGQLSSGFLITALYEDTFGGERLFDRYGSSFIATRAVKPF